MVKKTQKERPGGIARECGERERCIQALTAELLAEQTKARPKNVNWKDELRDPLDLALAYMAHLLRVSPQQVSIGEFTKIIQLRKEIGDPTPAEIKVRWIEE